MAVKKKFLFFDGSPKFNLSERYYVAAGFVASENKIDSVLKILSSERLKIKKRKRKKEFKKAMNLLCKELSSDFEICISVFDKKRFNLSKSEKDTYNFGGNLSHCKFEKGERGIIGRFWAQEQWLPVEKLKRQNIAPILCMDREEEWILENCLCHFDNQTKNVKGASFHIKTDSRKLIRKFRKKHLSCGAPPKPKKYTALPMDIKKKKVCFALVDYIAYYFSESIKRGMFPEIPISPYMKIHFMFGSPLSLKTRLVPF